MSILIRTGSGKTDLSYTENAVKNLKVLQKTGAKSVQWITTQAGTTYNNILQKRGVKDLFYGDITIPSDVKYIYNNTQGHAEAGVTVAFVGGHGGGSGRYCDYDPRGGGILIQKYHDTEFEIRLARFSLQNQIAKGKTVFMKARVNEDTANVSDHSYWGFYLYGYTASKARVLSITHSGSKGTFTVSGTTTGEVSYLEFSCYQYTNASLFQIWLP